MLAAAAGIQRKRVQQPLLLAVLSVCGSQLRLGTLACQPARPNNKKQASAHMPQGSERGQ
jgi:hypothetical protein